MKIFLMGNMAFVDIYKGYMLCIGSKAEVDAASPQHLIEMIHEAIAYSQFRSINVSKGQTLH